MKKYKFLAGGFGAEKLNFAVGQWIGPNKQLALTNGQLRFWVETLADKHARNLMLTFRS